MLALSLRFSNYASCFALKIYTKQQGCQREFVICDKLKSLQKLLMSASATRTFGGSSKIGAKAAIGTLAGGPGTDAGIGTDTNFRGDSAKTAPHPASSQLLMIEGDDFYISSDGVSKTHYRLFQTPLSAREAIPGARAVGRENSFSIEEIYDIELSQKKFILREDEFSPDRPVRGMVSLGIPILSVNIQEIEKGVFTSAGTGSATWEASIAMTLFFSARPHLLQGATLELGCGVGLGGILTSLAVREAIKRKGSPFHGLESLTLTDCSQEVLEQCEMNVHSAAGGTFPCTRLDVSRLDWNDYCIPSSGVDLPKKGFYDTVIASDCAYLYPDVVALSQTVSQLLRRKENGRNGGLAHIFGPYNRGALHEMIQELKNGQNMGVSVDWVEVERCRLKPPFCGEEPWAKHDGCLHCYGEKVVHAKHSTREVSSCASRNIAKFLHITAWHAGSKRSSGIQANDTKNGETAINDID